MGIAQKVARNFSDSVRSRGQSYFSKGRVSLMSAKPNEVLAKVRGTTKYRVRVRLRGTKLLGSCTCPYFSPQGEPCKHLWATLLLADSRGFLQTASSLVVRFIPELPRRGGAPISPLGTGLETELQREPHTGTDLDLGMNMGGERLPRRDIRPSRARNPRDRSARSRGIIGGPGGSDASWVAPGSVPGSTPRDRRAAGRHAGRSLPGQAAARVKPVNRNAKRLLVYVLDVTSTQSHNQVVIDLARRQRKPTGEWGPLRPWWYAPRAAHVKYDPEDRLLLALLDEAHHGTLTHGTFGGASVNNGVTTAANLAANPARAASDLRGIRRFVLRKDQAGLVERLAKTGRLRLRRTDGEDDPPTMRWDDGQPWRFCLDIRTEAGGKRWAWRGGLRRGENRMDLAEPLVLLPGLLILGVGRAARFDDLGVMPWILRLRYEKEITFVEPQQDLMLGRILAETRVPPLELIESIRLEACRLPDPSSGAVSAV